MSQPIPSDLLRKVSKLVQLPEEVQQSRWAVSVTRLTILKSLCQDQELASRFVTFLARKNLERVNKGKGRSAHPGTSEQRANRQMMTEALAEMEAWIQKPSETRRQRSWDLLERIRDQQNEYQRIKWGAARLINDPELLLFEYALHCLLGSESEAGQWAYQMARHYAERYDSRQGSGLIAASVPLLKDIADFWLQEYGLDPAAFSRPAKTKKPTDEALSSGKAAKNSAHTQKATTPMFTERQGQFLAFIHLYRKLHRRGPAELDIVQFFRVTPPTAHGMVVRLEQLGLVTRQEGVPRSISVAIPEKDIPSLEDAEGSPW